MIEYQLYCSTAIEGFTFPFLKEDVGGGLYKYTALRINRKKKLTKRIVDSIYKIHEEFRDLDFIWFVRYFHTDLELIDYLKYYCYPHLEGAEFNIVNNYVISKKHE